MMQRAYLVRTGDEEKYACAGLLEPRVKKSWFAPEVMTHAAFEEATHTLSVLDKQEHDVPSENLHDVDRVDSAILALSERAWSLLPALREAGCRIAEHVKVTGAKQYKLVFPARVLDILDHQASEVHLNMGGVSHVRNRTLYDDPVDLPLLFQVLYRGPTEARPSIDIFASQEFVDAYNKLGLTGADFYPVKRA
jgi:hypothetical protein